MPLRLRTQCGHGTRKRGSEWGSPTRPAYRRHRPEVAAARQGQPDHLRPGREGIRRQGYEGGARSVVLNYRRKADGLDRRSTIGASPDWPVAAARDAAKRLKREIDAGGDPVGEHREQLQAPTVNDLCDRYEAEELAARRPSTQVDYRSKLRVHIRPGLGKRKVASIEPADVKNLHRTITAGSGPYAANRVVALFCSS